MKLRITNRQFHVHLFGGDSAFSSRQIVLLVSFFLIGLNFMNLFYYLVFIASGVFLLTYYRKIRIPVAFIPAFGLALSLLFFSPNSLVSFESILKPLSYPLCVLLGYNFVERKNSKVSEKQLVAVLLSFALGAFTHYCLNFLINFGVVQRNTADIWTGTVIAATGQAALCCLMLGVSVAVIVSPVKKHFKYLAFLVLVLAVYYNLILAGRTVFVLIIVAFFAAFIYAFSNGSLKQWGKIIFWFLFGIAVLLLAFSLDIFGIQDIFFESNFFARFFGDSAYMEWNEDGRMARKIAYFAHVLDYPWGGFHIRRIVGGYAHDIFLDTYDEAGIFSLLSVSWFMCDLVIKGYKICRAKRFSSFLRTLTVCTVSVIVLQFMAEPILAGMPWLLASVFALYGAMASLVNQKTSA